MLADSYLTMTNCTVSDNASAGSGAGVFNWGGTVMLTDCTIRGNSAANDGGGVFNFLKASVTLESCTISNNRADGAGGGIGNFGMEMTLTNSTVSGNTALSGGGIFSIDEPTTLTLTNCTLSENSASVGGGIGGDIDADTLEFEHLEMTNSIIANSSCSHPVVDGGHNLQWPGTDCGETIPSLDPLLDSAGLADNGGATQTIALLPGSPAIDAGEDELCSSADQRGFPRPAGLACDIGAYEAQ
jgi:hypothetical protein